MELNEIIEAVGHILLMVVFVVLVTTTLRRFMGDMGLWVEILVMIIAVAVYISVVKSLGVAPASWE